MTDARLAVLACQERQRKLSSKRDDGSPALGVVNGALISSVIWAAIVIWAFF